MEPTGVPALPASVSPWAAALVLGIHVGVIGFNLFWLAAIPLGAWRGWRFIRNRWWRVAHLAAMAVVAGQAVLGRACFLTLWQDELAGFRRGQTPLIMGWVNKLIFWPLPLWIFALGYCVLFAYTLALFRLVPPRRCGGGALLSRTGQP